MINQYGLEFYDINGDDYMYVATGIKHTYHIKRTDAGGQNMYEAGYANIAIRTFDSFAAAERACNEHNDQFISKPEPSKTDMVNNPPHYNQFPLELKDWNFAVIDKTITDKHWASYFKTCSEYIHRAALKNGVDGNLYPWFKPADFGVF